MAVANRQSHQRVSLRAIRRWALAALHALRHGGDVAIHVIGAREMTRLNQQFLQHEGSTDIITFDHGSSPGRLVGELFISIPDAVAQAASFRTSWEAELGRYIIHGLLHLAGEDDREPANRRRMKRRENALLRRLSAQIPPCSLRSPRRRARRASTSRPAPTSASVP